MLNKIFQKLLTFYKYVNIENLKMLYILFFPEFFFVHSKYELSMNAYLISLLVNYLHQTCSD